MKITLYGRIPSKKNCKQRTKHGLISSKKYLDWEKSQIKYLPGIVEPLHLPKVMINYSFYMPDHRKTDLSNKVESVNDMLVKYGLLEDDNWTVITQFTCKCLGVDKENPRVEIDILELM